MKKLLYRLSRIFGLLFFVGSLGVLYLYYYQEKLLFFPETLPPDFQFSYLNSHENEISLSTGARIHFLVFNSKSERGVILYFHGNAGSLASWGQVAEDLVRETGWSVWIMDYPGYGKSSGPIPKSERPLLEMARVIETQMGSQKPNLPVVYYGRSIGTGIASMLSLEKRPSGLILESPYKSVARLGHEIYPFLPESFSRFNLENETGVKAMAPDPTLIFHGTSDGVIPFKHGKELSESNPAAKFVPIEGGDHNNLSGFSEYWPAIRGFLSAIER